MSDIYDIEYWQRKRQDAKKEFVQDWLEKHKEFNRDLGEYKLLTKQDYDITEHPDFKWEDYI